MSTFILFGNSVTDPTDFFIGREVAQANGLVTLERMYEADEPQPDGTTKLCCVVSIQADGTLGWRPKGTRGPFELAVRAPGFYLFAPGVRLAGDLKKRVYALARFEDFTL